MRSDRDNRPVAAHVLKTAHQVVTTERGNQHGDAENSFTMIADLWSVYLSNTNTEDPERSRSVHVTAYDVAQMMTLLKIARAVHGDMTNADHYIDAAGYTGLAAAIAGVTVQYAAPAATPTPTKPPLAQQTLQRTGGAVPDQKQELAEPNVDLEALRRVATTFAPETK